MSLYIISQILIGFAIVADLASFQFKQKKHIVYCFLISCTLIALHFMCLGHWSAVGFALLSLPRFIVCLYTTSTRAPIFFLVAVGFIGLFTYDGYLTLLGCAATSFGTIASFCENDKRLRQFMAACAGLWIIHNYLAGSPGAVLLEAIFLSSNLVGYFRYYILPRRTVVN